LARSGPRFKLANPSDPFSTLGMKRVVLACYLTLQLCLSAGAQSKEADTWDLVRVFNASTHVFYGEVTKIVPERTFQTGVMGVAVQDLGREELPVQEIFWPEGKCIVFSVQEAFKGPAMEAFECYRSDQDATLWTYVENDAGDIFLSPPVALDPLLLKLDQTNRGLFFVRYYLGSNIPVLYHARFGKWAEDDLALLRTHQAAGGVSLEQVWQEQQRQQQLQAAQEAVEFKVFEDEYYKMLRIRELDIRRSLLEDLVVRMGFEGRWSYYEFKERYLQDFGAYLEVAAQQLVPSDPTDKKEKLWKTVSDELNKIDVILNARAARR
jgi:hypothetical protein